MNRNIKGWTYRVFAADLDAAVFGAFAPLIELWRTKAAGRPCPEWREFDPLDDLEDWWGRLSLARIKHDPFDIEFQLWGTTLSEWWGMDYTRKKMSDVYRNRKVNWDKYEGPYFRALIDTGGIGMINGDLRAIDRGHISVCGIDLPLLRDGVVGEVLSGYRLSDEQGDPVITAKPVWQV